MTDRNEIRNDSNDEIMDDRTEGSLKQTKGEVKEGAGKAFGDEKLKREGQAEQSEGKLQNAWGSAKDKAKEMVGDDDNR